MTDLTIALQVATDTVPRDLNVDDFKTPATGAATESTLASVLAAVAALTPAGVIRAVADANLSGDRAVAPQLDGGLLYASNTALADMTRPIWLTTGAISTGQSGLAVYQGLVNEPTWTWTPDQPIYLGVGGLLTQTVPTVAGGAVFLLQLALALSATSIFFNPKTPILLS